MKGFTLIEFLIVSATFIVLIGLSTVNLFGFQHKSQLSGTVSTFLADMKGQQVKAMTGDTEGTGAASDYGVYLQTTGYTLFRGSSYTPANTTNFVVTIPAGTQITSTFSGPQIIFAKGSGEVGTSSATITLLDTGNNTQKTVNLNRYGVVVSVN